MLKIFVHGVPSYTDVLITDIIILKLWKFEHYLMAVSYTHLDVYKRQAQATAKLHRQTAQWFTSAVRMVALTDICVRVILNTIL